MRRVAHRLEATKPTRRGRAEPNAGESGDAPDSTSPHGAVATAGILLLLLGVVMSYSTTAPLALEHTIPPHFARHLVAVVAGITAAFLAARLPLRTWHRASLPLWLLGLSLLAATALWGVEINAARRWLGFPGTSIRFQPGEFAKWATILAVAAVVAQRDGRRELGSRRALAALALLIPPVCLLIGQPDFGSAVLLALIVALVLAVAGMPLRWLAIPGGTAAIGIVAYIINNAYAMRRVTGFMDPWSEARGSGFQLIQSFVAFGNGGLLGAGLGNGRQKLFYLPEAHTDFVLAVVAEELGLVGVLAVLGAFAALLVFGIRIARQTRDRFSLLIAFAMTGLLTIPAAINAAVVMGMLPTKGLTLPFLSYGRTSLIMCCVAIGMILGIGYRNASQSETRVSTHASRRAAWG